MLCGELGPEDFELAYNQHLGRTIRAEREEVYNGQWDLLKPGRRISPPGDQAEIGLMEVGGQRGSISDDVSARVISSG